MIYIINFDGIGDCWYTIPVLKKISDTQGVVNVYSVCEQLNDPMRRFDFINLLSKEETVKRMSLGEDIVKLFQMENAKAKGLTLLNCETTDYVSDIVLGYKLKDSDKEFYYPKIKTKQFKRYDMVFHIAKTWDSRSISEETWKLLYKKYSKKYSIALIGKTVQATDMVKTICKIDVPDTDNYVDKLTIDETMNLIDNSNILVTGQGGISVLSGSLKNPKIVVAEGCVKKEFRPIIRNNSRDFNVKYVRNKSGIYYTGDITQQVTRDVRQQPDISDIVNAINSFL